MKSVDATSMPVFLFLFFGLKLQRFFNNGSKNNLFFFCAKNMKNTLEMKRFDVSSMFFFRVKISTLFSNSIKDNIS